MTDQQLQPLTPPVRQSNRYAAFKETQREIIPTVPTQGPEPEENCKEFFSVTITASIKEEPMRKKSLNEPEFDEQFLIDLVFKPNNAGLRLTPEQSQLILAHIGEILKELEMEEQLMIDQEKEQQRHLIEAPEQPAQENAPCR